jgi:hypothetical protein
MREGVIGMAKEKEKKKECCDIKVTKTKGGFQVNVTGVEAEKLLEHFMKCSCMEDCCK